jgi:hypothetical protein
VSEILETLKAGGQYHAPTMRVLCGNPDCRRVYVTTQWPRKVEKLVRCRGCKNRRQPRERRTGRFRPGV